MPNFPEGEKKSVSLCWKIWGICILECRNHPQRIYASGYNNWNEYLPWHVEMSASGYPQVENWAHLKRCNSAQCNATQQTGRRIFVGILTSWQSTMQSNLVLSDYHLFGLLKQHLGDHRLHNMRMWKWLFTNGCKCKSQISTEMEFLNSHQDGINVLICSGIMLKNYDTSAE